MHTQSAAEIQKLNIEKMGETTGLVYSALWQELALLYMRWNQYVELFGTSKERIDLLNRSSGGMARTIQDTMWESVLLHLARLIDPPHAARKPEQGNLSFQHLCKTLQDSPIHPALIEQQSKVLNACSFAKNWRDKYIAHRDLDIALKRNAAPLAHASRALVKEALQALSNLLNIISEHYLGSTTGFEHSTLGSEAVALLHIIKDGNRYREAEEEQMKNRTYNPDPSRFAPI